MSSYNNVWSLGINMMFQKSAFPVHEIICLFDFFASPCLHSAQRCRQSRVPSKPRSHSHSNTILQASIWSQRLISASALFLSLSRFFHAWRSSRIRDDWLTDWHTLRPNRTNPHILSSAPHTCDGNKTHAPILFKMFSRLLTGWLLIPPQHHAPTRTQRNKHPPIHSAISSSFHYLHIIILAVFRDSGQILVALE